MAGPIAAVALGIAALAGAVVAIRIGAGDPVKPAPPMTEVVLPDPRTT
jgi:hypothetical protein